jgi:hypothetical protein
METIFYGLQKKVSAVLAKYGIEYIPDATPFRMGEILLKNAGYDKLSVAKAFGDKRVVKDYEKILEYYMPEKQLEAKLEKDEIDRVTVLVDYTYIPRIKNAKN